MMAPVEKPSALSTPFWVRSSVTIRVMVVEQMSAASRKKNTGKTMEMPSTIAESLSKQEYPTFSFRVRT